MCYPEDAIKGYWDLLISIALIATCSLTPYAIAFSGDTADENINIFDFCVDTLFGIDIVIIFNSAFYDDDFKLTDQYKQIACYYVKGWFFLDLLAIFPFNFFVTNISNNINEMARIFRLGRLYKLVKLLRLVRILKILKQSNKIMKIATELLKIS